MNKVLKNGLGSLSIAMSALGYSLVSSTLKPTPAAVVKLPHQHGAAHGGSVLMFGDDHVEIKKGKGPSELEFYFSDKFRQQVAAKDFLLQLALFHGEHRMELPASDIQATKKEVLKEGKASLVDILWVDLKDQPKGTQMEIKISRTEESKKTLPAGYLTKTSPQKIQLEKLLTLSSEGHEKHHM